MDPNFGPVSIVASEEAAKLGGHPGLPPSSQAQQLSGISIKEERLKESPSPHDQPKHMPQQQVSLPNHILSIYFLKYISIMPSAIGQ